MVVKNREKRVTGGGRQEIDVRQLEGDGRRATVDRCEGNWSVMGDESVGVEAVFSGICSISFTCARVVQGALELVRLRSEAEQERRAEAKEQRMQSRIYSSYAESRLS